MAYKCRARSFQCLIFFIFIALNSAIAQVNQNFSTTHPTIKKAIKTTGTIGLSDTSVTNDINNGTENFNVLNFYPSEGITINAARRFAYHNGWKLATANDIEKEWQYNNFHLDKCGLIEDGQIAVPLQKVTERFNKGTNIGVETEEINGFFYYTNEQ